MKQIVLLLVFVFSLTLTNAQEKGYWVCYECGSKKYIEWDYKVKKCPQCEDGIIDESDEGVLIMAD
jgi:hypothetical protein